MKNKQKKSKPADDKDIIIQKIIKVLKDEK